MNINIYQTTHLLLPRPSEVIFQLTKEADLVFKSSWEELDESNKPFLILTYHQQGLQYVVHRD